MLLIPVCAAHCVVIKADEEQLHDFVVGPGQIRNHGSHQQNVLVRP